MYLATVCWGDFDGFICWPHGTPGMVHQNCPDFLDGLNGKSKINLAISLVQPIV